MKQQYECLKCGYKWKSRKDDDKPVACPRCKRYDWNEKVGVKEKEK